MPDAQPDQRPTPDPTILTTEQLERAIGNLKDLMGSELRAEHDLCNEKFHSVNKTLTLIESQRVEQKQDTKAAVDAALAAAKEAVKEQTTASALSITKSETATAEQLRQLSTTFTTANTGLTLLLNDLKTRVERIENLKQGGKDTLTGLYALAGVFIAVAGLAVTAYISTH